jgi:hypothetical protein
MCRFDLDTCPFPHHDPVSALIFLPRNASLWKSCSQPKPWGRLSCGNLIIRHAIKINTTDPEPVLTADCNWCTAVLRLVATKSKEIQQKAHSEIKQLEEKLYADIELAKMQKDIEALELQLAGLRARFFEARFVKGTDGSEWEEVKAEP